MDPGQVEETELERQRLWQACAVACHASYLHGTQSDGDHLEKAKSFLEQACMERVPMADTLEALESTERVHVANRIELTVVENQPSFLQVGENVPLLTGTVTTNRGVESRYSNASVGTMFKVETRLSGESDIVLVVVESSGKRRPAARARRSKARKSEHWRPAMSTI